MAQYVSVSPDGLMWRLHGATAKDVYCFVVRTANGHWTLTLQRDLETVLHEPYGDAADACTRAAALKDGLIEKGWTQVPISLPSAP